MGKMAQKVPMGHAHQILFQWKKYQFRVIRIRARWVAMFGTMRAE